MGMTILFTDPDSFMWILKLFTFGKNSLVKVMTKNKNKLLLLKITCFGGILSIKKITFSYLSYHLFPL